MSGLNRLLAALRQGYHWPGHGLVVVARWPAVLKAAVFVALLVVFWGAGWFLGPHDPSAWRIANLPVDVAAIFLWGTGLGLCFIAGNTALTYVFLTTEGQPFVGGWVGPLMALVLALVGGLLRAYILHLHDVQAAAAEAEGMVAICSHCKRIRAGEGDWQQVDHYVEEHSTLEFTHSICPVCLQEEMQRFDRTG